jgi:hypothetical protein
VILLEVVGNFFLFCNVFRVARALELIWAVFATVLTITAAVTGFPGWTLTAICCGLATALVIVYEMKKTSYHGWGWKIINPELPAWWDAQNPDEKPE